MRVILIVCLSYAGITKLDPQKLDAAFTDFSQKFKIAFRGESDARKKVFADNLDYIETMNAKDLPFKLGVNEFAHLSSSEFIAMMSHKIDGPYAASASGPEPHLKVTASSSIDWQQKGAVTEVKNQGQCGGCWSFSATGALEGHYFIKHGQLVSFSEQELMDCSRSYGNQGCRGGIMDMAFKYVRDNGIGRESDYPYTATDRFTCRETPRVIEERMVSYASVRSNDMNAMKQAVTLGPVSVAIEASSRIFQLYESGVLDSNACGTDLDHGVLVVGYGSQGGQDYWKVKNSWGPQWGMEGYVLLAMGMGSQGQCGVLMDGSYPIFGPSVACEKQ